MTVDEGKSEMVAKQIEQNWRRGRPKKDWQERLAEGKRWEERFAWIPVAREVLSWKLYSIKICYLE